MKSQGGIPRCERRAAARCCAREETRSDADGPGAGAAKGHMEMRARRALEGICDTSAPRAGGPPSATEIGVPDALRAAVTHNPREAVRKPFAPLLGLWNTPLLSWLGHSGWRRFSDRSQSERERLLSWSDPRIPQRRAAFPGATFNTTPRRFTMKRFAAICVAAASAAAFAGAPVASADSSSPPSCYGQEISNAAAYSPGLVGTLASGYAHYFNSQGLNLGQAGIPFVKATCPTLPPPPPTP